MIRASCLAILAGVLAAGCASRGPTVDRLGPDELFERGMASFEAKRWTDAIRAFDRLILESPSHPRIQEARFRLAEAYFMRKEYLTAASEFVRLATDYPSGPWADDARFKVCEAYRQLSPKVQLDQEYTRAAIDHCQSLITYYPESEYVPRAQELIRELTEKLADKVYSGGEFYEKRRAYDSAILYFEDVVKEFPRTAAAPKALLRLVHIYQQLGYAEEAQAARERLLREYPDTAEAKEAEAISLATAP
ncbi:MAG TPA: outer membrane protein assembly factor BamD [Longimicrobiales bacterium]|nr:outer membrane protein assembly factor BamD [Longimicrobiales bacterium]